MPPPVSERPSPAQENDRKAGGARFWTAETDAIFEQKRLFIIGCNPFKHYAGVEKID